MMTTNPTSTPSHILVKPLASLRFLLAMVVVLNHTNVLSGITTGRMSLATFFVISGFFLEMRHSVERLQWSQWKHFMFSHVKRFYVLQWLCLAVWLMFSSFGLRWDLMLHATLTQCWYPDDQMCMAYNGASWFISTLIFAYMMFPVISRVTRVTPAAVKWTIVVIALAGATWIKYNTTTNYWWQFFPPTRLIDFTYGVLIAQLVKYLIASGRGKKLSPVLPWIECLLVVAVVGTACVVDGNSSTWAAWVLIFFVLPTFTLAAHYNPRGPVHRVMSMRWLYKARNFSFELYMLYLIVMAVTKIVLEHLGITLPSTALVALFIILSIFTAIIVHNILTRILKLRNL